jgi:Actin-like ATPase involved in cell morphogenesis
MINFIEKIKKIKALFFPYFKIFIDLGTSLTKIAIENKGIILRQPTYLAYDTKKEQTIFIGEEAKNIVGKTPEFIKIIRPIVTGVISDFDSEVLLLKNFLQDSIELYTQYKFLKPIIEAISMVPTTATEIEQKAVKEVLNKTDVSQTYIIEKALATAAGCGLNIFSSNPNLIIEIGGGLTEISIIGSGNIIRQKTLKFAGDHFNKIIANYLYLKHAIILGENTCEELKINLLNFNKAEKTEIVRGKSLETGLPKSIRIKSSEIREALLPIFNQIVDLIKELIESCPPEILDEILKKGVIITGGSVKIEGIDYFFAKELNLEVFTAPTPQDSTINGLIELSKKDKKLFKNLLISI